MMFFVRTER